MNQLEQFETDNDNLGRKLDESRRKEMDIQERCEQLEFELDMSKRVAHSTSQNKDVLSKKEDEMLREINNLQE